MSTPRWQKCVYHRGRYAEPFLRTYVGDPGRRVLLIAGAGFDPRSGTLPRLIAEVAGDRVRGCFLREDRPTPPADLLSRADSNEHALRELIPTSTVDHVAVFSPDTAVIGGRAAVRLVNSVPLDGLTDVFVDLSALSIGVAFPVIRHLAAVAEKRNVNLHVVVVDEPATDAGIEAISTDAPDTVHGFKGGWGLDANSRAVRLWMPQLARGKRQMLERIHQRIQPHAVCPILPFPADNPRLADELMEHYQQELENTWAVDARDIVYASERDPLDLYRTILRLDDARRRVFAAIGGSQIILSPVGSKALALGALMAALDRDFTIMYVEALGYTVDFARLDETRTARPSRLVHIWLYGDAYSPIERMGAAI